MAEDDWKSRWKPVQAAIGEELGDNETRSGVDVVEPGTLRRYLEPLEFGCALHYDADVARQHGYDDVILPYTAIPTYTMPAMWRPGDPSLYSDDDADAQPSRTTLMMRYPEYFPKFSSFFATDTDIDYIRPVTLGERVQRRGNKLVACDPKETKVGRGAFIKLESEFVAEDGEVIARVRTGLFLYDSHEELAA